MDIGVPTCRVYTVKARQTRNSRQKRGGWRWKCGCADHFLAGRTTRPATSR